MGAGSIMQIPLPDEVSSQTLLEVFDEILPILEREGMDIEYHRYSKSNPREDADNAFAATLYATEEKTMRFILKKTWRERTNVRFIINFDIERFLNHEFIHLNVQVGTFASSPYEGSVGWFEMDEDNGNFDKIGVWIERFKQLLCERLGCSQDPEPEVGQ